MGISLQVSIFAADLRTVQAYGCLSLMPTAAVTHVLLPHTHVHINTCSSQTAVVHVLTCWFDIQHVTGKLQLSAAGSHMLLSSLNHLSRWQARYAFARILRQ